MEENVVIESVVLDAEQYGEIMTELQQQNENVQILHESVEHATVLLAGILLFTMYNVFRRSWKKGGA